MKALRPSTLAWLVVIAILARASVVTAEDQQAQIVNAAIVSSGDTLSDARMLATTGRRTEALEKLRRYLVTRPTDTDARTFYGIVLSWEGRYDEAREALNTVLAHSPTNGDALTGLVNVELWSGHPEQAEALTRRAIDSHGENASLLVSEARALNAMNRLSDAHDTVKRALVLEPTNEQALRLSRSLEDRLRHWRVATSYETDWFSDGRDPWGESQTSISREGTPVGSMIFRFAHADRFGYTDNQFEAEMYPKIRPGTYAYVGVGASPQKALYPGYRVATDLYQSLGSGFEGSVGFRRLGFTVPVNIYVGTLTKYMGGWMFTGRTFYVPDRTEASHSFHGSVRRYMSDGESYVGFRYGHGFWRDELYTVNDFVVLNSDTISGEANMVVGTRWTISFSASTSREERIAQQSLGQHSFSAGVSMRF